MDYVIPPHPMSGMDNITAALLGIVLFHKDYAQFYKSQFYKYPLMADCDCADWLNIVRDELGWQWVARSPNVE
jgi:hypothetical protein